MSKVIFLKYYLKWRIEDDKPINKRINSLVNEPKRNTLQNKYTSKINTLTISSKV